MFFDSGENGGYDKVVFWETLYRYVSSFWHAIFFLVLFHPDACMGYEHFELGDVTDVVISLPMLVN